MKINIQNGRRKTKTELFYNITHTESDKLYQILKRNDIN